MSSTASRKGTREELRNLPTPVRPILDANSVQVPEGYKVEVIIAGLSFPTGMVFVDDDKSGYSNTLFINEGGSTWPTRPAMPPRILKLDPSGEHLDVFATETLGGPRGLAYRDGSIYVTLKGGLNARIAKYDIKTGKRLIIIDKIPSGGWHEPGGPVFSPHDDLMYFAHGSVAQNGVVLPEGFTVDIAKHPHAQDIPGQDVTLTGNNVWSRNPLMPYPYLVETGPFKPFGVPAKKEEIVEGKLWCTTGVWRSKPDGSESELIAWGIRNPYGMAFSEDGELYISDNDFEEKGERAIAKDPDRIWHIRNAKKPPSSIKTPDWYGFPDICSDGLPVWDKMHLPQKGKTAEQLIQNPPPWAGPAAYLEKPHTGMAKMDFCRSDSFGHRGKLFVCEWGTLAPLNSPCKEDLDHGFQVMSIDTHNGTGKSFMQNRKPEQSQADPKSVFGTEGLQRPVDCKFHPDGHSLYVLDFGIVMVSKGYMMAFAHTGVLWRITRG